MTLPINILQSLISRNRTTIMGHHSHVVFWKSAQHDSLLSMNLDYCHKQVEKYSKDIAKLVLVQKALKKELAEQIATDRDLRYMANLRSNLAARFEKAKTEAMDRAGEVF